MTSNPELFVNPDPDGTLYVYNEDLITAVAPGTVSSTYYVNYQSANGQGDGVYLITESEIVDLVGREGDITSLGLQFKSGSFTLPNSDFSI